MKILHKACGFTDITLPLHFCFLYFVQLMHNSLYIKADGLWMYIHCLNFLFHVMCNIYYDINMF